MVRRASAIECELEQQEGRLSRGEEIDLDKFTRAASHLRRILESLGLRRRPRDVETLHSYLATRPVINQEHYETDDSLTDALDHETGADLPDEQQTDAGEPVMPATDPADPAASSPATDDPASATLASPVASPGIEANQTADPTSPETPSPNVRPRVGRLQFRVPDEADPS